MPRDGQKTRSRILLCASRLFYKDGIRNVSIDSVVEQAGVTKRTFYYHFDSKDQLVADYLDSRDQPTLDLYQQWFDAATGELPAKIEALFLQAAKSAQHPKWRGCGFMRTVSELANKPGHPAVRIGSTHKKRCEAWLADQLLANGCNNPSGVSRQVMLLLEGAYSIALVHHDAGYFADAGSAAGELVRLSLD